MKNLDNLIKNFAQQITKARCHNYSQELLEQFLQQHPQIINHKLKIYNVRQEKIEVLLLENYTDNQTCIIYAHGLGSNKMETLPLLNYFVSQPYSICLFDFTGSGKSQGEYTSFGIRQKDDVTAILTHLDFMRKFRKYVLWGRSMGSAALVLSQSQLQNPKVKCVILDSPFHSFQKIAVQLASKKSWIPKIVLKIIVQPLKRYFSEHFSFNPFNINVSQRIRTISSKIMLIYSKKDSVIDYEHSKQLAKECKQIPEQLQIKQDHNTQRSYATFSKISQFIKINLTNKSRINIRSHSRGIKVFSKQKQISKIKQVSKIKYQNSRILNTTKLNFISSIFSSKKIDSSYSLNQGYQKIISLGSISYTQDSISKIGIISQKKNINNKLYSINSICHQNKQNIRPSIKLRHNIHMIK